MGNHRYLAELLWLNGELLTQGSDWLDGGHVRR